MNDTCLTPQEERLRDSIRNLARLCDELVIPVLDEELFRSIKEVADERRG